jgi:hypothetical protein
VSLEKPVKIRTFTYQNSPASAVINPFIYAIGNRKYRLAYINLFSKAKFWDTPFNSVSKMRSAPGLATDVVQQRHQIDNTNGKAVQNAGDHRTQNTPITIETSVETSSKEAC